jgi:hypothetical protein
VRLSHEQSAIPATSLISRRPSAGQPVGECRKKPSQLRFRLLGHQGDLKPSKGVRDNHPLSKLKLDDSALDADHGGVGSVVGAQFGEDIPDVALDGFFANRKLRGNPFVGIPFGNQAQDADFRWG